MERREQGSLALTPNLRQANSIISLFLSRFSVIIEGSAIVTR